MTHELSASARHLWAKTGSGENSHLSGSLLVHLADTAEVTRILWQTWLPVSTRAWLSTTLDLSASELEPLVVSLAAMHDLGKATPAFQAKVPHLAEEVRETGLDVPASPQNPFSHALASEVIVTNYLVAHGYPTTTAQSYGSVLSGHHGSNPNEENISSLTRNNEVSPMSYLGDASWQIIQTEVISWALQHTGLLSREELFRDRPIPPRAQILLTGLIIMADWIASNCELFPLSPHFENWQSSVERAQRGWNQLALPSGAAIVEPTDDPHVLFCKRFGMDPVTTTLRSTQLMAFQMAKNMEVPGIMVIEDSMGSGKTETSLLCAEVLMAKFGCGGVAYLLPTQATSNAMFSRVERWLSSLLRDQNTHNIQDLHLLHGKAALNEDFSRLATWGKSSSGDDLTTDESIVAHQWFSGNKRGLLAPFVVGTIDQLLMGALKTKHVHLRHLGLANKVVIVDEVHAYDAYMNAYLERMLSYLGAYHVPVILLSATLPSSRRERLLQAYQGREARKQRRRRRLSQVSDLPCQKTIYPLISTTIPERGAHIEHQSPASSQSPHSVYVRFASDDDESLVTLLKDTLRDGGCACVLRNTVHRAQDAYHMLQKEFAPDVVLAHSRYVAYDRAKTDRHLTELLGARRGNRPQRLVVVATQVLEQSLDIDLDLLITDIAPIDLLLQRMGRLHRHTFPQAVESRPPLLQKAQCIVTGITGWDNGIPVYDRGCTAVYQPALLYRSVLALQDLIDKTGSLLLPADIAPLVEKVYERRIHIPQRWQEVVKKATALEDKAIGSLEDAGKAWLIPRLSQCSSDLHGWMRSPVNIANEHEGRAAVRASGDSIEVVLVTQEDTGLKLLPWIAQQEGVSPDLGSEFDMPSDDVARVAALCTVTLPPRLCAPGTAGKVVQALYRQHPAMGWQDSRWLHGALPLVLNKNGEVVIACDGTEFVLRYERKTGLELCYERR